MSTRPKVLNIGVDEKILALLAATLNHTEVSNLPLDLDKITDTIEPAPSIILVSGTDAASSIEYAQTLRMLYPNASLFICCTMSNGFERKDFIKNGFNDAFLVPVDVSSLKIAVTEAIAMAGSTEVKVYRSVKLLDIEPGETLNFDTCIFMPANNKYVKISNAGDEVDKDRLEKIKKNKFNNLHVPLGQIQNFYEFSAKQLRKIGNTSAISATERKDKLASSVRELMSGLFSQQNTSFESGQAVMKNCGGIVSSYILQGADAEWYTRIQQVLGEFGDHYSHSANVSTFAALFSMGLGIGKPEDLALAGMLHDIGKAQLPMEIQQAESEDLTKEQFEIYKKHPELSVELIKQKKILVPEIVMKTILQHHELYNGSGFPRALMGDRICKEAQLLALADKFDHLTKLKPGRPLLSPLAAVELLKKEQLSDPTKIIFNPELLKNLLTLFPAT